MILTLLNGWKLAAKAYPPSTSKSYILKQQFKILLLVLIYPKFAKQWFATLNNPWLSQIYRQRPRLYVKPLRVYMSIEWDVYKRTKVILDTYRLLTNHPNSIFNNILTKNCHTVLAKFQLKNGSFATASAGYDARFRKEGEVGIFLDCEELGGIIASIAFSFEEIEKNDFVCRIGCVQGNKIENKNIAKEMQKLLHGQRPSSLLLLFVQEFIKYLDITELYGASDSIQANLQKHAIHIHKLHNISFSYDKFWTESQGILQNDGWFKLPTTSKRRQIKEIKSKKRVIYKKRYRLHDNIIEEFGKHFDNSLIERPLQERYDA